MKVGFISTYNQRCGLATYLEKIREHLGSISSVVFAPDVSESERVRPDAADVLRCWKTRSSNLADLRKAILAADIDVLHINCQHTFFEARSIAGLLSSLRKDGVHVVSHVHNPMAISDSLQSLIAHSDKVVVHTPENKLEVMANGASAENVHVIEHWVEVIETPSREEARSRLGIPENQRMVLTQGFLRYHKGLHEGIAAIGELKRQGLDVHYWIVGSLHSDDHEGAKYLDALKMLAREQRVEGNIHFDVGFHPIDTVRSYLRACDAALYHYTSNFFEASGTVSTAFGCGAAVVTSTAPTFARYGETVFHSTAGFPLATALRTVICNEGLREHLQGQARLWAQANEASSCVEKLRRVFFSLGEKKRSKATMLPVKQKQVLANSNSFRVAFLARENVFTAPGGDTVVLQKLLEQLPAMGVEVVVDTEQGKSAPSADLAHLFNFSLPQQVEAHARRCVDAGLPYVVTPFFEDWGRYAIAMCELGVAFSTYLSRQQPKELWPAMFNIHKGTSPRVPFDCSFAANNAEVVIVCGTQEEESFRRYYPETQSVMHYHPGCDNLPFVDHGERFKKHADVEDYVLCVGRLENRKNQLMVMKAFEDSDITLVFATGSVVSDSGYTAACRAFRRKGKTLFLERLPADVLSSAYAGARAHVLPSWCELPGLVSLEAARLGAPVVVCDYGTIRDYLGDSAWYCEPDDEVGLREAVLAAWNSPKRNELAERAAAFTWKRATEEVLAVYQKVLGISSSERSLNASGMDASSVLDLLRF